MQESSRPHTRKAPWINSCNENDSLGSNSLWKQQLCALFRRVQNSRNSSPKDICIVSPVNKVTDANKSNNCTNMKPPSKAVHVDNWQNRCIFRLSQTTEDDTSLYEKLGVVVVGAQDPDPAVILTEGPETSSPSYLSTLSTQKSGDFCGASIWQASRWSTAKKNSKENLEDVRRLRPRDITVLFIGRFDVITWGNELTIKFGREIWFELNKLNTAFSSVRVSITRLLRAAFYSTGREDEVTCHHCKLTVRGLPNSWQPEPFHRAVFETCPGLGNIQKATSQSPLGQDLQSLLPSRRNLPQQVSMPLIL